MQEEILKLYEKIQDQLSQEEFLAEMDQIRKNNGLRNRFTTKRNDC